MAKVRRVGVFTDTHCGHRSGLTIPNYETKIPHDKWSELRATLWYEFAKKVNTRKRQRHFDTAIWLGDLIDGRGERSGSTELIATDRQIQCDMASDIIKFVGAKHNVIIRGTPYHTGNKEDWENIVAEKAMCGEGKVKIDKVGDQEWPSINGVVFDCKHKIGGTSVFYGKGTAISKERFWNLVHNEFNESQPKADIILRAHVHFFFHVEDANWHGFVCPGLQGLGSKYGSRGVSGIVHFGFVWFDITTREDWFEEPKWNRWILTGSTQRKEALIL